MSTVETTMAAERRRLLRFLAKGEARRGETATAASTAMRRSSVAM